MWVLSSVKQSAIAISSQISAWLTKDYLEERAKQGRWDAFERVLAKGPDVESDEIDRL